jgi:hypothetical protein
MATARERYEKKTRVVTFRVRQEVFDQIEEIKAKSGLSNADLIKLGAGIAHEEIMAKLTEMMGLNDRLAELRSSVTREEQRLRETLEEEKRQRLEELDIEIRAFKLFDRGWRVESVSLEIGIPEAMARHYFDEWAKARKDKKAAEKELLMGCLKQHIHRLESQRAWVALFPWSGYQEKAELLEKQIEYCRHLLTSPKEISKDEQEFLITKYSSEL